MMENKRDQTALNWLKRSKTISQFKALSKEDSSAVIVELITNHSHNRRIGQPFTLKEMKRRIGRLEGYSSNHSGISFNSVIQLYHVRFSQLPVPVANKPGGQNPRP